jgi:hypothetical protein
VTTIYETFESKVAFLILFSKIVLLQLVETHLPDTLEIHADSLQLNGLSSLFSFAHILDDLPISFSKQGDAT